MKSLAQFASKIVRSSRIIFFILTLVLFVLAAGAPAAMGTIGG